MAVVAQFTDVVVTASGFPLLSGLTLDIHGPGVTVLTGPNGAGKTSVLRLLGGLLPVASGHARILDIDITNGDRRPLRRRAGWLGHEGSFYDELTASENLVFAARSLGRPVTEVPIALERVGLGAREKTLTRDLSAGQRRRMTLAWLLVRRPELWLLDEPYASLDAEGRVLLNGVIADVVAGGATVVVSSHDSLGGDLNETTVDLRGGRHVAGMS